MLAVGVVAFGTVSCGGGSKASSNGSKSKTDAGTDGSVAGCTTDSDCASKVPTTTPPGCAVAKCDTIQGACVFPTKDTDGDGHTAAICTAKDGTPIQTGDDCNDSDPKLWAGHPEPCQKTAHGGTPTGTICIDGHYTCNADGTESMCKGTIACTVCVNGKCAQCQPNTTQCSGQAVQTCSAAGSWGTAVPCSGAAPVSVNGVCAACTPNAEQCSGQQPQKCDSTGHWQSAGAACTSTQVCQVNASTAACKTGCEIGGAFY